MQPSKGMSRAPLAAQSFLDTSQADVNGRIHTPGSELVVWFVLISKREARLCATVQIAGDTLAVPSVAS